MCIEMPKRMICSAKHSYLIGEKAIRSFISMISSLGVILCILAVRLRIFIMSSKDCSTSKELELLLSRKEKTMQNCLLISLKNQCFRFRWRNWKISNTFKIHSKTRKKASKDIRSCIKSNLRCIKLLKNQHDIYNNCYFEFKIK